MSNVSQIGYPARRPILRRSLARRYICPECAGSLDTGWECNGCGYDAMVEATTTGADTISHAHLRAECERVIDKPKSR